MLMPKKNIKAIYENLFKEGVMVAEKNKTLPSHPDLERVPNLQVIKTMQSLKSRGYVEENFAWRHYYWRLTNEGIQYLREVLHLPAEIVPATLKKPSKPDQRRTGGRQDSRPTAGMSSYRRAPGGAKSDEAGAGSSTMQFHGSSFGRGSRMQQQ